MNACRRSALVLTMALTVLIIAESTFASNHRPRGRCKKKCCACVIEVPGMGTFQVDFAGCGVSLFPDENDTDTNFMSELDMIWGFNILYANHPVLGLLSAKTDPFDSIIELRSISGSTPLFPATARHELNLQIRVDGADLQMFTGSSLILNNNAPIQDLSADPSTYTAQFMPLPLFDENNPTQIVANILSADVEVMAFEGFRIDTVGGSVDGMDATFDVHIVNELGVPKEIIYFVCATGDVTVLQPLGDPRMLGTAQLVTIGNDPLPVRITLTSPTGFDDQDSVYLVVNTTDASKKGAETVIDISEFTALQAPAGSTWAFVAMAFLLLVTALAAIAGGRDKRLVEKL